MTATSRILIVDDDESLGAAVSLIFQAGGFGEVVHTAFAEDAYTLLGLDDDDAIEPRFDVILLDLMMPEIDGIEACARIRMTRRYRDVPILMFSGLNEIESLNQAFIAGANDFLSKPVKNIELLARVRSAMQLKRELDRRRAREAELLRGARKDMPTTADIVDLETQLPGREAFAIAMRHAVENERSLALLALRLADVPTLRQEAGEDATRDLIRKAANIIEATPAPLGWLAFSHGAGLFIISARDATERQLALLGKQIEAAISSLKLPHSDDEDPQVARLDMAVAAGAGTDLLTLPAELIRALDTSGALYSPDFDSREEAA